ADIEVRHGDVIRLEESSKDLDDMFIDMAALVRAPVTIICVLFVFQNALDYYTFQLI
ncbi:unnamed protein product, partial [Rotaria sp. Silwood2]